MDNQKLWYHFTCSGKVEDYLRYRGIVVTLDVANGVKKEESGYGNSSKTTSDDRWPDSAPL